MSSSTKRIAEDDLADQQPDGRNKRRKRKNKQSNLSTEATVRENSGLQLSAAELTHAAISAKDSTEYTKTKSPKHRMQGKVKAGVLASNADKQSATHETVTRPQPEPEPSQLPVVHIPVESDAENNDAIKGDAAKNGTEIGISPSVKKQKRRGDQTNTELQNPSLVIAKASSKAKKLNSRGKHKKLKGHVADENSGWILSSPVGGTFLNIDPILTPDNEHLILLTKHDVQIYSTKTSLLVRSLVGEGISEFNTCSLSKTNHKHLFVSTKHGSLIQFDWTTGRKMSQYKIKPSLWTLFSIGRLNNQDEFYGVRTNREGNHELLLIATESRGPDISFTTILQCDFLHNTVCFSQDCSTIIACGRDRIFVGQELVSETSNPSERQYEWETVDVKGRIVSFDARFSAKRSKGGKRMRVAVAVGLHNGALVVYNDIVSKTKDQSKSIAQEDIGRKLHWHRTAVKAVKWSRDGNYLISGGDETVLVIWQLDTNQKQFLPHLSTSILNITISHSGAHYALRLGDNSVMVLSTADLLPSTNISGLLVSGDDTSIGQILLHPIESNKMLAAVSSRALGSRATGELTHLQVYDIDAKLQLSKQALTRNFTTAVNVGPAGQPLREPSVLYMCITTNGQWLATVDEWKPHSSDLASMYLDDEGEHALTETTLRIWAWSTESSSWIPNTRIDVPYSDSVSIIAMSTNPTKLEFATLGEDGLLKMWTPKARTRNGLSVKDENGNELYTWSSSCNVQIENFADASASSPTGALSYADDGTVIAAYCSQPLSRGAVHFIDPTLGTIVLSQLDLVGKGSAQLKFHGRSLIVLSDRLTMFDTIMLQIVSCIALYSRDLDDIDMKRQYLALDASTNTIAVGSTYNEQQQHKSRISIFSIDDSALTFMSESAFSGRIRALLSDNFGKGFLVADADATVWRFTNSDRGVVKSVDLATQSNTKSLVLNTQKGVNDIFSMRQKAEHRVPAPAPRLLESVEASGASTLEELFNNSAASGTLSVQDLFQQVAKAVSTVRATA